MGLFGTNKKTAQPADGRGDDEAARFFDETFREELRNHGRWYFEKVISENGASFKEDLSATVATVNETLKTEIAKQLDEAISRINDEVKQHLTQRIEEQLAEYNKAMKSAQDVALQSVIRSAQVVREQHEQLASKVQQTIAEQEALFTNKLSESNAEVTAMRTTQAAALETISNTAKAMQEQHQKLATMLESNVANQEAMLIKVFEENMAKIIEHYLLGAVGDQYDMKTQLPAIIQQLEANKQAIVDDMKL
jgi:predicted phage tail protein